jgi:hypothetical protein
VLAVLTPVSAAAHRVPSDGEIDFGDRLQSIDGFGFAVAFQRAAVINGGSA